MVILSTSALPIYFDTPGLPDREMGLIVEHLFISLRVGIERKLRVRRNPTAFDDYLSNSFHNKLFSACIISIRKLFYV